MRITLSTGLITSPVDSVVCFVNTYLLDGNLSFEQRYPAFRQLGPDPHRSNVPEKWSANVNAACT